MDSLVARYSQPAVWEETAAADEQDELLQTTPSLNLKFALPPVSNVSLLLASRQVSTWN